MFAGPPFSMEAIDSRQVNVNVFDFACYLAKLTHSRLTGVFLDTAYSEPVYNEPSAIKVKDKLSGENIRLLSETCANRGTNCSVYNEITIPLS